LSATNGDVRYWTLKIPGGHIATAATFNLKAMKNRSPERFKPISIEHAICELIAATAILMQKKQQQKKTEDMISNHHFHGKIG